MPKLAIISVLRLGHRRSRDKRITTHVGLVSRVFGAHEFILSGEKDDSVLTSIREVLDTWGGHMDLIYQENWRKVIQNRKKEGYLAIHLTMYGLNINKIIDEIKEHYFRNRKNLLIIVGAEKVPREVYELADYNIAIGNQPHSEVAALAVFLDRLFDGKELEKKFDNAKLIIIPQPKGKKVIKIEDQ